MKVFITGITGQLAPFLVKRYLNKGYSIIGGARRSANWNPWRLEKMGVLDKIQIEAIDLADQSSLDRAIEKHRPNLVANLGAQSYVAASWNLGAYTLDVTGTGAFRVLDAVHKYAPDARFLQMSSSELFGNNPDFPYNEKSLFMPRSPYAIAKAVGFYSTVNFRESYGMFASNLISFNFESYARGREFVTKRIVQEATRVCKEINEGHNVKPVTLGNMDACRDWIWAGDTAQAIDLILDYNKPDDFCIASGVTTSVRDFCAKTFKCLGHDLTWEKADAQGEVREYAYNSKGLLMVQSLKSLFRPADVPHLIGDATKAKTILGWTPTKNLDQIIEEMVKFEQTGEI